MNVTISFTVRTEEAQKIMAVIESSFGRVADLDTSEESEKLATDSPQIVFSPSDARLAEFAALTDQLRRLVEFVVRRGGEFYNDELAAELGLDTPASTSTFLAKITQRLRKAGMESNRSEGNNWYKKRRVSNRTVICVRPDALAFFKEALRS
jgi:hypothetical protein